MRGQAGTARAFRGTERQPTQWGLRVALPEAGWGQGQNRRAAGLTCRGEGLQCPTQESHHESMPSPHLGLLPLLHSLVIWGPWGPEALGSVPASMGPLLGSILIWLLQILPSASSQSPAAGRVGRFGSRPQGFCCVGLRHEQK